MKRVVFACCVTLALSSCGSKPAVDETNASVEEVAEKVRQVSGDEGFVRPGKWVSSVTIEDVAMPGLPPEAVQHLKDQMVANSQSTTTCLTPEQAKKPDAQLFVRGEKCRYDHFKMGNGKIDAEMHCAQGAMTQVTQMTGTYSPDAYAMHMTSSGRGGPSGEGNMSMKMKVEAKRVGDCTGDEEDKPQES